MKIENVPQDDNQTFKGYGTKVIYAVDHEGRYKTIRSSGWEVEETVLRDVVNDFRQKASETKERVIEDKASPIEYFMYEKFMDLPALSRGVGFCQWRVKRHLKPSVFARLNKSILRRYADFFNIDLEILLHFKEKFVG